jgi:hypothetical protein
VLLALSACDSERPAVAQLPLPPPSQPEATASAVASAAPAASSVPGVCTAPSLDARGPLDARSDEEAVRCASPKTGTREQALRCGQLGRPFSLARLDRAVLPFDAATLAHVRAIADKGKKLGRRPRVFGLVGDSMTVSGAFLARAPTAMAPEVAEALATEVDGDPATIVDYFSGEKAARVRGAWRDSFRAPRAAKVGARASWPLEGGVGSPLDLMLAELSPASAVVLFGGNDAAYAAPPKLAELEARFAADLERVIAHLEERGVIPILNTLARHGHAPGVEDCPTDGTVGNWRIAVQTNALSAKVVEIACRLHLPLIDVRDALDAADALGLGKDGVHPSFYADAASSLEAPALACGYNIRNYVTLRMLKQLKEAVLDPLTAEED